MRHTALVALFMLASSTVMAEPSAAARQRAGELAAQSAEHYKRHEYEVAAALLREAYGLYPQPNLLYNLARSLEKAGDTQGAIDAYEQYLASPGEIRDRGDIESRVKALRAQLPTATEVQAPPNETLTTPPPTTPPPPRSASAVAAPTDTARHASALPWAVLAGGVAAVGVGGGLGYLASSRHKSAESSPVGTTAQSLQHQAQTDAEVANVLLSRVAPSRSPASSGSSSTITARIATSRRAWHRAASY